MNKIKNICSIRIKESMYIKGIYLATIDIIKMLFYIIKGYKINISVFNNTTEYNNKDYTLYINAEKIK